MVAEEYCQAQNSFRQGSPVGLISHLQPISMSRKSKRSRPKKNRSAAGAPIGAPLSAPAPASGQGAGAPAQESLSSKDWLAALLLVVTLLVAYYPALHGTPLWDDDGHLTRPELRTWAGLWRIWFDLAATQQYYPATHSAFWLEHRIWGDWYTGYHLVNVLLHALSALLLMRILRRLEIPGAWLAGALWALHPMQVESVAWMSELKNTLSGVLYFASALLYLRFHRDRSWQVYFAAFGLFVLGMFAKSVIDTLPAALLLLFFWKHGNLHWRRDVRPLIPFFLTGIAYGLLTAGVERNAIGPNGNEYHFSLIERGLIAGRAFWFYLGKLLWPADLIFSYPRWQISASAPWQYLFPTLALGLAAWLVWMRKRWGSAPMVALLYFAGTLFPALGFISIYPFRYSFVADHFQYLASAGPIALLAAGMERVRLLFSKRYLLAYPGICLLVLAFYAILTWRQSGNYRDSETLWRATIAANPQSWLAHNNLGSAYLQQGRIKEAIAEFDEALILHPDVAEPHNNLGTAVLKEGQIKEAVAEFGEALKIDPANADAHNNLGNLLLQQGRLQDAIAEYQEALQIRPAFAGAYFNLGSALLQQGNPEEAIADFRQALQIDPDDANASYNLANVLSQQGRTQEAIAAYRQALQSDQSNAMAHNNLGLTLFRAGETGDAIAEFRESVKLDPANAQAHYNLGIVLLQNGQPAEGITQLGEEVRLNPADFSAHMDLANALLQAGRTGEAIAHLRKAADLKTGNPVILRSLAAAYAADNQFPNAVQTAQAALQFAEYQSNTALAAALRRDIILYNAGHPAREGH